jgi:hypothetical protein
MGLARVARPPKLTTNGSVPELLTDFRPRAQTTDVAFRRVDMPRVLLLRQAFQSHNEFEIFGGTKDDTDTISKPTEARPDLVVLEIAGDPNDGLNTAEKLKCNLPRVPLFLPWPRRKRRCITAVIPSEARDLLFPKCQGTPQPGGHDFSRAVCACPTTRL